MEVMSYFKQKSLGQFSHGSPNLPSLPIGQIPGDQCLESCCVAAARAYAKCNQMVACADCKQILKFFREARPLHNYLKFCESNRRTVRTGLVGDYFVVGFSF
jgi:hypothetical protein